MIKRTAPLLAALLLGTAGMAFAQGNPPTTASPNPATAAGQQTQQGTPMGTTGTPTGQSGGTMAAPSTGMGTTTTTTTTPMPAPAQPAMRPARADRN
jgi:hypothetical protein